MNCIFWDLTDEQILSAIDLIHDSKLQQSIPPHPMQMFVYDNALQKLAFLWLKCNGDRTLMKLKYSDEIKIWLDNREPWFTPAGMARGTIPLKPMLGNKIKLTPIN